MPKAMFPFIQPQEYFHSISLNVMYPFKYTPPLKIVPPSVCQACTFPEKILGTPNAGTYLLTRDKARCSVMLHAGRARGGHRRS